MAPLRAEDRLADLRARYNQLSIRREELVRRFPGSFGLRGEPAVPLGPRAPDGIAKEWTTLTAALQRVETELASLSTLPE
jgi:hypothetical protein